MFAGEIAIHAHRLLIVDDEEGPRQSLRIVFKDDYHLFLAEDGHRAIELIKNNRIDAAILDIRLNGMSGIELLERLREFDPAVEVVMLPITYRVIAYIKRHEPTYTAMV